MRRVVLESPYAGTIRHVHYLSLCLCDSLTRGEAPIASHGLFPQFLDDHNPEERRLGIEAGRAWISAAEAVVFYTDYGISPGMQDTETFVHDCEFSVAVEYRKILNVVPLR